MQSPSIIVPDKRIVMPFGNTINPTIGRTINPITSNPRIGKFPPGGGGPSGPYVTTAVNFDGTNDYGLRGSDLTGNADSAVGIFSFWIKFNGGDGVTQTIFSDTNTRVRVKRLSTTNKLEVRLLNAGATAGLVMESNATIMVADGWTHVLVGWDQVGLTHSIYIDDVSGSTVTLVDTTATIDYTQPDFSIGANISGTTKLNACLADFQFENTTTLDFPIEANRRLFIDASGKPADPLLTGLSPIILLKGDETDFYNNLGPGGAFVETGALTACSDSPSD